MAARKRTRPTLLQRTPVAEWAAAGLGLLLTTAVVSYLLWEAIAAQGQPPMLTVTAEPARVGAGGYVVPVTVRNASRATAAEVEVVGVLERAGEVVEERSAHFPYVPGRGKTEGGLTFQRDPSAYDLRVVAGGYARP